MGSNESAIYHIQQTIREYLPKATQYGPLPFFNSLWNSTKKMIDKTTLAIEKEGKKYLIKSEEELNEIQKYSGYLEIFKLTVKEEQIKLFEGNVKEGMRMGFGIVYGENQQIIYRGLFKKDLYEGWGKSLNYEGQFKAGKRHGWGVLTDVFSKSKFIYEGQWADDKFDGFGCVNVPQQEMKELISRTIFVQEHSQFEFKFIGQWKSGRIDGKGKLIMISQIYVGDFRDGLFEGEGTLINASQTVSGIFKSGKRL